MPAPRFFSEPHPRAVDSLARVWLPWIRDGLKMTLRPWQALVLQRALEVDADGVLVWRDVVVSVPRQQGKGFLLWALACARAHHAAHFGEVQEIGHFANNLAAARRIHSKSWRWAEDNGVTVRKAFGNEKLIWEDSSHWSLLSLPSVWGSSQSLALMDEAWDIPTEIVESGVLPTMVEREQPQLWLFSTANAEATDLMPGWRKQAISGSHQVMIAEWSMGPKDDPMDPAAYRRASAHWSTQREEMILAALGKPSTPQQWGNLWVTDTIGRREWPMGWARARAALDPPPFGLTAGLECSGSRGHYSVALTDGQRVWSRRFTTIEPAISQLSEWAPAQVACGLSLRHELADMGWTVRPMGSREMVHATPLLADLVRRNKLTHNGDAGAMDQSLVARAPVRDGVPVLSSNASKADVDSLKAIAFALLAQATAPAVAPYVFTG